jgi:hypothetical protein
LPQITAIIVMDSSGDEEQAVPVLAVVERGPLAKLPIEWLVQVIQWLPTQYIFTIMRVNREWECACRYVIKWRKTLILITRRMRNEVTKYRIFLANNEEINAYTNGYTITVDTKWNAERMDSMRNSLKQMENLIRLISFHAEAAADRAVIIQNASTLKQLFMDHVHFKDMTVVFPELHSLTCETITGACAKSLPVIKHLTIRWQEEGVDGLPFDQLLTFDVRDYWSDEQMISFMQGISNMRNLTQLCLGGEEFDRVPVKNGVIANVCDTEEIDVNGWILNGHHVTQNRLLIQIFRKNPSLRKISIACIGMDEDVFKAIAELENLTHINIYCSVKWQMLLILMSSKSIQHSIREFTIRMSDWDLVEEVIKRLAEERGTTYTTTTNCQREFSDDKHLYGTFILHSIE